MKRSEADDLIPTCGCGDPESVCELVHWTLEMFAHEWTDERTDFMIRALGMEGEGTRDAMFWAFIGWFHDKNLIEHGTTVRGGWLTDRGRELLAFLNEHGCDSDKWPWDEEGR